MTNKPRLKCPCGASAKDTSKERGRFLRRHREGYCISGKITYAKNAPTSETVQYAPANR